jgi:dienelactone hydrolase
MKLGSFDFSIRKIILGLVVAAVCLNLLVAILPSINRAPIPVAKLPQQTFQPPAAPRVDTISTAEPFDLTQFEVPNFPELGAPSQTVGSGVQVYRVNFSSLNSEDQPGFGMNLRIYHPAGEHEAKSLPLVIVASSGSPLVIGKPLTADDYHDEALPYAEAGAVVVHYSLDGAEIDPNKTSWVALSNLSKQFQRACAGLVNARFAIEFALNRIETVDPERIISSGHSSAGALSVLLAAHEPRLKACIAFCPVIDVERWCQPFVDSVKKYPRFNGLKEFLKPSSPANHVAHINCPVYLFHSSDDPQVPFSHSELLRDIMNRKGKECIFSLPPAYGGHYQPMIDEGIPRAIKWLKSRKLL